MLFMPMNNATLLLVIYCQHIPLGITEVPGGGGYAIFQERFRNTVSRSIILIFQRTTIGHYDRTDLSVHCPCNGVYIALADQVADLIIKIDVICLSVKVFDTVTVNACEY